MEIAIVAVAYNRIDSLKRLLYSLEKACYLDNSKVTLIISIDKSNTSLVESFADNYFWPHGIKIVDKHEKNLGLRSHMMSLGKWFNQFDAIIVLEDDIVVSPSYFFYVNKAVETYSHNLDIAGISLYGFNTNYQSGIPFEPVKDKNDVYFMNCAMSWGEVWMRDSWNKFYEWYLLHQDFPKLSHLPYSICSWNDKSWLKFHTRYCIEENKYFVHPYVSLTTNFGDAGVHSSGASNTLYQVGMQMGKKENYTLPETVSEAVVYDGFFENTALYNYLSLSPEELCLDLQGEWNNRLNRRYWLTTQIADFKIVRSFGLNYRPIEMNVLLENAGRDIFLYDTTVAERNPYNNGKSLILYYYRIINMFFFVREYGWGRFWSDTVNAIKGKIRLFK